MGTGVCLKGTKMYPLSTARRSTTLKSHSITLTKAYFFQFYQQQLRLSMHMNTAGEIEAQQLLSKRCSEYMGYVILIDSKSEWARCGVGDADCADVPLQ